MPLQDVLDSGDIADEVLAYCASLIRVLASGSDSVIARRHPCAEFNAVVQTEDGSNFTIWVFDGLVDRLRATLDGLGSETIDDAVQSISLCILGSTEHAHICYRIWLVQAIVFVVLHELAHVLCGHFAILRDDGAAESGAFALAEIRDEALPSLDPSEDPRLFQLIELEADEVALDRMLALAYELFCADETVQEMLIGSPASAAGDVAAEVRAKAEELTFYAACTAMALIEAHGKTSPHHPPAFSRMFSLMNTYVRRLLTANEGTPGVVVMEMTESTRRVLSTTIVPAVFNAMDIADTCCRVAGVDLAERFGVVGDAPTVAGRLASDLLAVLTGGSAAALSKEGARYEALRVLFADFNRKMAPHRRFGV